ncbi:MAG: hypothetical protein HY908_24515 [Myxococcales bacterium]|nr:hypothetical protein [Myxococcales bacterium]
MRPRDTSRALVALAVLGLVLAPSCGGRDVLDPLGPQAGGGGGQSGTGATAGFGGAPGGQGGTGGSAGHGGEGGQGAELLAALQAIDGATVSEELSDIPGYRFFVIELLQPMDHDDPSGPWFPQRLALHHRDGAAPLVLGTTGYALWLPYQYLDEPTTLLDANQLLVEERYFSPSRPEPADWSKLDIRQAAADHHRIVEAFRPLYPAAWISEGASKGGMTSVYHRRFYPDDVTGTVAYVAPHSQGLDDPRYVDFVASVGDAACRQALRDFQRELLLRRGPMLTRMADDAVTWGVTYDLVGLEPTFEVTVLDLAFGFWQYHGANRCPDIPPASASDDALWAFFDEIGAPTGSSDEWVRFFEPYYWQAETELGAPAVDDTHLADLLLVDQATVDWLPGIGATPVFDPSAMADVQSWLATEGSHLLFVYGETDPWSAGAFELGAATDAHLFVAPGANHGALIANLTGPDQAQALAALAAWAGVSPAPHPLPAHAVPRRLPPRRLLPPRR